MKFATRIFTLALLGAAQFTEAGGDAAADSAPDARVREVVYDEHAVVTIDVRRGVATQIDLDPSESIAFAATGYGADCEARQEQSSWCISAIVGEHVIFVKPRSNANTGNNLQVVTKSGRGYSFEFVLLGPSDLREPVYRLAVHLPKAAPAAPPPGPRLLANVAREPTAAELVAKSLRMTPNVANSSYSLAVGKRSEDIVPRLVFDDGRFTYFGFPGNRSIPVVFERGSDGVESLVNAEMEGELLRVDRIGREFYLRMGDQAVRIWNDAFDVEGLAPFNGTTVQGVRRAMKSGAEAAGGER